MEKTAENRPAFSSQMRMIDFHAHLSFEGEAEWRQKQGILTCFSAGTPKQWEKLEPVRKEKYALASFGIHPWYADQFRSRSYRTYLQECDMIGEIGMDSVWCRVPLADQQRELEWQLQAAEDLGKPAVLHTKGQERRIGEMIRGFKGKLCVHWYSGSLEDLEGFLEQDCYFTLGPDTAALVGGKLGADREEEGKVRRRLLEQVPASRLFVETDGIGAVAWAFGEEKAEADRVPLALRENMECAAAWKKMSVWQMADRMEKNLKEFLSPRRSESEKETV